MTIPSEKIHQKLKSFAQKKEDVFFIEIGAFDGKANDPLFELVKQHNWKGILVEPQKDQFEQLKENYSDTKGLIFENVAIAEKSGSRTFYAIRPTDSDNDSHGQLNSFNKEVILKHTHMIEGLEERIYEMDINCLSFDDLLEKHGVDKIDVLAIDTEGFDYEIIKQIDFKKIKPTFISFEHVHLSDENQKECFDYLRSEEYKLIIGRYNSLAYL